MVTRTGMTVPSWAAVFSLKLLQNSIILTPCWPRAGPTGGEGVPWPAGICNLTTAVTFLAMRSLPYPGGSGPLHLKKVQFKGGGTAEDADHDPHLALVWSNLLHHAVEVNERAIDNPHRLSRFQLYLRFRLQFSFGYLLCNSSNLLIRYGGGG